MTEKELKKLNRYQLLELLLLQSKRVEELEKQLEEVQKELTSKQIHMEEIGSIAEAAVQISGVLEAAQNAADLYLSAMKEQAACIVEEAKEKAEKILKEASQREK